jgi:S1-C subfamily serine protease
LLVIVAGALAWNVLERRSQNPTTQRAPIDAKPRAIVPRGDLAEDEKSTIELFESVSPSAVHITSLAIRRSRLSMDVMKIPQGTGSGFIWDNQGHVVTNFHVVMNNDLADVTLHDNTVWRAKVVGRAPDKDIAVLKIEAPAEKLPPIAIGTSSNLQVGQKVFAIGNPFGLDQTLTTGVISGLGREIESVTQRPIQGVIQTDAAINRGNSGGPLLDSSGRLIGINTAILSPSGAAAGVGFAVPVDTVNRIVPQLVAFGKIIRPGLGIAYAGDQIAKRYKIQGVVVMEALPDSAAKKAGIQGIVPGKKGLWELRDIVVGLNDTPVRNPNDLYRVLDELKVGDTVDVELSRKGERRVVKVTLQPLPERDED